MPATLASLGIDDWSDEDLRSLADEIDRKLDASAAAGLSAAQDAELDRRTAEYDADPTTGFSHDEVFANARRRIGK